jgi:fructokinase
MRILSIGEILWDVFPDSTRLGGAPFNFAVHAHRLGHDVSFLSAVGDDAFGTAAIAHAAALGLSTEWVQAIEGARTGQVTVRLNAEGQPDFTIHRPAAYDCLTLDDRQLAQLAALRPDWIYFGTLYAMNDRAHAQLRRLLRAVPDAKRFYDVNLRRGNYTPELIQELLGEADAVKLSDEEESRMPDLGAFPVMAITRGAQGCTVRIGEDRAECPGYGVAVVDTVGAGDAFAAAFVHGLGAGWSAARTGDFANRLGALVASRAGATPEWTWGELEREKA